MCYDEANHSKLLTDFGWLSVRNLIKLDMGIFAYKELNSLHPEQDISPFQKLDEQHTIQDLSSITTYLFQEVIHSFSIGPCHTQEADCGMKSHMRLQGCRH